MPLDKSMGLDVRFPSQPTDSVEREEPNGESYSE